MIKITNPFKWKMHNKRTETGKQKIPNEWKRRQ